MKSKLAFVRQPDSIPRKTAFSLRCFAAILLRLPPKTEAHSTPLQGGEYNRIRFQTVHQEQSCWAVFLFGGDAYSVSAFQNHHRQAQPRAVRCCRSCLPERRTAVQRVRPENEILQQEERASPCRDHAAIPCAARICRPGNPLERRRSRGEPVELPACTAHRAGVPGGGAEGTVSSHAQRILSGAVCFQGHDCGFCHPRQGRWKPTRPHSADAPGNGRTRQVVAESPKGVRP